LIASASALMLAALHERDATTQRVCCRYALIPRQLRQRQPAPEDSQSLRCQILPAKASEAKRC